MIDAVGHWNSKLFVYPPLIAMVKKCKLMKVYLSKRQGSSLQKVIYFF